MRRSWIYQRIDYGQDNFRIYIHDYLNSEILRKTLTEAYYLVMNIWKLHFNFLHVRTMSDREYIENDRVPAEMATWQSLVVRDLKTPSTCTADCRLFHKKRNNPAANKTRSYITTWWILRKCLNLRIKLFPIRVPVCTHPNDLPSSCILPSTHFYLCRDLDQT